MHYVKQFHINGVDTKQVGCIELQSKPNAATEGAVGVLGIDMSSPTHDVYKCVAVNGGIYTWELLSSGMSIISAKISGEGGEIMSFSYDSLLLPQGYILKIGDLILDSEGYLYQINWMGIDTCSAIYTGTHIGSAGGKTCRLVVTEDGKLQLVTENGAIWSSVDYLLSDGNTIYRDPSNGNAMVIGVKTVNDTLLKFFVGTQSEYDVLTDEQKQNLFALITDDMSKEQFDAIIEKVNKDIGEIITVLDEMINTDKWTVMSAKKDSSGNMINEYVKDINFSSGSIDKIGKMVVNRGDGTSVSVSMPYADTSTSDSLGYRAGIIGGEQSDVSIHEGKITVLKSSEASYAYTADFATNATSAGEIRMTPTRTLTLTAGRTSVDSLGKGIYLLVYNDSMTAILAHDSAKTNARYITLSPIDVLHMSYNSGTKFDIALLDPVNVQTDASGTLKIYYMGYAN